MFLEPYEVTATAARAGLNGLESSGVLVPVRVADGVGWPAVAATAAGQPGCPGGPFTLQLSRCDASGGRGDGAEPDAGDDPEGPRRADRSCTALTAEPCAVAGGWPTTQRDAWTRSAEATPQTEKMHTLAPLNSGHGRPHCDGCDGGDGAGHR